MKKLTLYTTSCCTLCEKVEDWLGKLFVPLSLEMHIVDIAEDDALVEHYGERIPVLRCEQTGAELGYPFTLLELKQWLLQSPVVMPAQWHRQPVASISVEHQQAALDRQNTLTKPPGSLGLLEQQVIRLAGQQHRDKPVLDHVAVSIFAADHGVCTQGVSAFPQEVTVQMMANFIHGGAAISVLASEHNCQLNILDMGTCASPLGWAGMTDFSAGQGTADMTEQAAMSQSQLDWCLAAGAWHIDELISTNKPDLFIAGEMGIGNTTSASAVCAALTTIPVAELCGRGTGLDDQGLNRKISVIRSALEHHQLTGQAPLEVLRCVGGFELAAITGAVIRCAQQGIPVLVDGFIVTAAVLVACRLHPQVQDWLHWAHKSAEPGHQRILQEFNAMPLLDLGLRLGEDSGAAVALPLLKTACTLHRGMHTFAEAGVASA